MALIHAGVERCEILLHIPIIHLWCESPILPHPKSSLLDWTLVVSEDGVQWTHCHSSQISFWKIQYMNFVTRCIILLEIAIRWWVPVKGWIWSAPILRYTGAYTLLNWYWLCTKKIYLTALHQQQPKLLMQGSMDHSFMLFMPNSDTNIWMLQLKLRLVTPGNVFPIFYCTVVVSLWIVTSLWCFKLTAVELAWSSAAVAHLQGSEWYAFRAAILHSLVLMNSYFRFCCLSIIIKPAYQLASDLLQQQLVYIHANRSALLKVLRPAHLAPTTMPHSK